MKIKVSIVEDDAQAREIFAGWINSAEELQCVSEHPTAEHALTRLTRAEPDVVLMDINLGGMTGVECVRQLKPGLPDTQFIMLTVYEDADHIFEALQAGATGYLLKQAERAHLLSAIREVHEGGSPMTPNIARKLVRAFQRSSTPVPGVADLSNREREVLELLSDQTNLQFKITGSLITTFCDFINWRNLWHQTRHTICIFYQYINIIKLTIVVFSKQSIFSSDRT